MDRQHKGASSNTLTQNTAVYEPSSRSIPQPLPQIPTRRQSSSTAIRTDSKDDDLVYNLVRREVHDYQSLERGPRSDQRSEHSGSPRTVPGPVSSDPKSSCPSISQPSTSAVMSPPTDPRSMQIAADNTRPLPCSPLQQPVSPNPQSAAGADEIVELQGKPHPARATEDKQGQAGAATEEIEEVRNIPNTNFAIACMVTFCFNLPLGILAVYFSLKALRAFQDGHTKLGEKRSRWSIFISLLGIAITTVLVSSIVLYIAMQGQKRISQYKAYKVKAGLSL